jgi:tetratricopeptide (TPR) repeat protein
MVGSLPVRLRTTGRVDLGPVLMGPPGCRKPQVGGRMFVWMLLFLLAAEAQTLDALPAIDVLDEGIRRIRYGDHEGAQVRLAHVLDAAEGSELRDRARFHLGLSLELEERYGEAVGHYLALEAGQGAFSQDATFRLALCLEDLGRHKESLARIRALQLADRWNETDGASLQIQRGVAELRTGRTRRGVRHLSRTLAQLEGTDAIPWMQGKARLAIARHQLERAQDLQLVGNRKAARRLKKRTALISAAEAQVVAIARVGEPDHVLEGLKILGDAYLMLHDDMLAAAPPRSLDADQVEIYGQMVAERVVVLRRKAARYYGQGVALAIRTGWEGAVVDELKARQSAL